MRVSALPAPSKFPPKTRRPGHRTCTKVQQRFPLTRLRYTPATYVREPHTHTERTPCRFELSPPLHPCRNTSTTPATPARATKTGSTIPAATGRLRLRQPKELGQLPCKRPSPTTLSARESIRTRQLNRKRTPSPSALVVIPPAPRTPLRIGQNSRSPFWMRWPPCPTCHAARR